MTLLYLVLLPILPAIWWIATRSLADAVVDIYLPAMVLVPMYYTFDVPHVVQLSACDVTLLPIVLVTLVVHRKDWRWRRCDLWLALFAAGFAYSNGRGNAGLGFRTFFQVLVAAVIPYIVGKLLMEQEGLRERFFRRLTWLVAIVAVLSVVEFRLSRNLFTAFFSSIFGHGSPNIEQIRGGFTRAQGPYAHAIYAGIIYGSAWIFALWLSYADKQRLGQNEPKLFGVRRSMVPVWLLFMGLVIALSRGPWLGAALAFAISRIGRSKTPVRATLVVTLLILLIGGAAAAYLNAYTSGDLGSAKNQDQENAIYRRLLLKAYEPITEAGGLFGWGRHAPQVPGLASIDNEYLELHLEQGLVGLWTFLLLASEAMLALIGSARHLREQPDFYFVLSMLAVIAGILLTITTVWVSDQPYQLLFLLVGWSFSLRPTRMANAVMAPPQPQTIRRIFA